MPDIITRIESLWAEVLGFVPYLPEVHAEAAEARLAEVYATLVNVHGTLDYLTREARWGADAD